MRLSRAARIRFILAISVSTSLFGCASQSMPLNALPEGADAAILSHISPELPSSEQSMMYNALAALNPEDRDFVVYFANDTFYVNDPSLSDGPFYYAPTSRSGVYEAPDGEALYTPSFDSEEATDARSRDSVAGAGIGPGYAVYSPAGYTDIQTTVTLPCPDIAIQNGESAYMYIGGKTGAGSQADVGLSLTSTNSTPGQPSYASPYLGATGSTGPAKPVGDAHASISCGQSVGMTFYITQVSGVPTVVLKIAGSNSSGHNLTIMKTVGNSSWAPQCTSCEVKYVTSLIQGGSPTIPAASYVGVTSPGQISHMPDIEWSNIMVAPSYTGVPASVSGWTGNVVAAGFSSAIAKCAVLHNGTPGSQQNIGIDANCISIPAK